jgi:antitoxin HicB
MYDYAIRFEEDTCPGLAVYCRDLPLLNSYGDDREHAISEAVDAIETTLSIFVDQRLAIPVASPPQAGEEAIHLPAVTVAKIILWNEMMARDMRKVDLCRLLGLVQTQGDRLVDFLHTSKMEAIEKALIALGKRIRVSIESA